MHNEKIQNLEHNTQINDLQKSRKYSIKIKYLQILNKQKEYKEYNKHDKYGKQYL